MQGSLLDSSSNAYRLLAMPLYLVGVGILNSLAFIPTSIWAQIGCGAFAVQAKIRIEPKGLQWEPVLIQKTYRDSQSSHRS
jgi:hypothetical protein